MNQSDDPGAPGLASETWDIAASSADPWLSSMLAGDFESAWLRSDAVRHAGTPDPHRFWNGASLAGANLMVRSLHGFGDAVQMLRFAPRLAGLAASVVYEVAPPLLDLAACFAGVERVITWGQAAPLTPPAWDAQVEIMELPYIFRTSSAELPLATRYLHLPPGLLAETSSNMGPSTRPRVGIVYTAGEWNPQRSIPPALLHPLLADSSLEFWNLQGGPTRTALASPTLDATAITGDGILALAATIAHLDLVITVDTLAAHLAGSLGVPVWLLLQHAADWRWQSTRTDSPWYPTMRIFRQPTPGDWPGLLAEVGRALQGYAP